MNTNSSRPLSRRNAPLATLFCTTSFAALAAVTAAHAQTQAPSNTAPVEEVLVTGSLISGTQAVGVPVTSLGAGDFQSSGAITIADLLKDVPALYIQPSNAQAVQGGNQDRIATLDIHKLGGQRTLMLIDGWRYPVQKENGNSYDPSIIPAIALDRVDVLADGASATYGSDAVSGVVNVILRRGFDGAVSQVRVGTAYQSDFNSQESLLFGRTWDTGDITLSFEHWETAGLDGDKRDFYTQDFTPWGLDNENTIKSTIPGIVMTGAVSPASAATGTGCVNCYSVPKGQNGVGLAWTTLLANQGTQNEINSYTIAQITNSQQRNGATLTFDQEITPEVGVFAEGFYSNRRAALISPATVTPFNTLSLVTVTVPTNNPYYPIGAPPGLRVNYDFARELTPFSNAHEIAERYAGGFNLKLPYDWRGKIFASINQEDDSFDDSDSPNANNISAALGNTVPATPAAGATPSIAAYTKPANVPYLNLFCDPTAFQCNSQATLDYINGYGISASTYIVHQYGANFDGPLFALPGGDVKAAVGGSYSTDKNSFQTTRTRQSPAASIVQIVPDYESRSQWAAFGQVNVPIVGDANAVPFFHRLEVEASLRYDRYSDFGGTTNPKLAIDWEPLEGLTLRSSWGTSFRAPRLADISSVTARSIGGINILGGAATNSEPACATVGGTPVAGTAAALLNPTCSLALNSPGGIQVQGGSGGLSGVLRPADYALLPEKGRNLSLGFDFAPKFLAGLTVSATWYRVHITNTITARTLTGVGDALSNPLFQSALLVAGQPGFASALATLLASPQGSNVPAAAQSTISWILDAASKNTGTLDQEGVDFRADYDWDMGIWGEGNTGVSGAYAIHQITTIPGSTPVDAYDTNGQPLAFRLTYRAHLGWNLDGFSATWFIDYTSHVSSSNPFPPAAFLAKFPNYSNKLPANFLFDLALGYNTGDIPANTYLKNLNVQLVVNNVLNRDPPFSYNISNPTNGVVGYLPALYSPSGRTLALTVTKSW